MGMLNNITKRMFKSIIWQKAVQREIDQLHLGAMAIDTKMGCVWNQSPFEPGTWDEFGFQVFSQSNEDGLIQYLIRNVDVKNKTFIEFGTENYTECNTKFLLLNNRWSGFIMDGSEKAMQQVKNSWYYWKYDLETLGVFITKENINKLLKTRNFDPEIGVLSIDIDGNDYWVWEAIEGISPAIIITEINPIFGPDIKISIPYKEDFYRTVAHYSNLYWGMSLGAAVYLANKKGYKLVCMNQLGHNAFFVREDLLGNLKEVEAIDAYRPLTYRESRNRDGSLSYLAPAEGLKLIEDMEVIDVENMKSMKIRDCVR